MTDRKAIEFLNKMLKDADEFLLAEDYDAEILKEIDVVKQSLSALQEREERSKGCRYCLNASIEPELEGCDLSYHDVGCSGKGYRFLVRAGNRKPVAILFEKWNNDGWHTIGIYEPNNCPMCGRKVKE